MCIFFLPAGLPGFFVWNNDSPRAARFQINWMKSSEMELKMRNNGRGEIANQASHCKNTPTRPANTLTRPALVIRLMVDCSLLSVCIFLRMGRNTFQNQHLKQELTAACPIHPVPWVQGVETNIMQPIPQFNQLAIIDNLQQAKLRLSVQLVWSQVANWKSVEIKLHNERCTPQSRTS